MNDRDTAQAGDVGGQKGSHFSQHNQQTQQQQVETSRKQKQQLNNQSGVTNQGIKSNLQQQLSSRAEKLILKLDDGQIVGSAGRLGVSSKPPNSVVLLSVEQALEAGRLGPKDAKRLHDILQQLPGGDPLETNNTQLANNIVNNNNNKRKKPGEIDEMMNKRPRSSQMMTASTAPPQTMPLAAPPPPVPPPAPEPQEDPRVWLRKCENILKGVQKGLGPNAHIFSMPVSAAQVPDYYTIVKNPMDLGTISNKLKKQLYSSPLGFLEDMRLVWSNCKLYNGLTSPVGSMGYTASRKFEDLWSQSALEEGMRVRRATAGVAANRFDPDSGVEGVGHTSSGKSKPKQPPHPPSRSKNSQQTSQQQQRSKKQQQQEVHSEPQGVPSTEVMQEVLGVLQEMVQNNHDALGEVIEIIRSGSPDSVPADQVEEFELDIEVLDAKTIWKLFHFVKKIQQKKGVQQQQSQQQQQQQKQQRSGSQSAPKGARVQESDSGSSIDSDDGDEESEDGD